MESKESNRIPRSEFENNQHHSKTHNSIKLFRNNYIDLCHIVVHIYSLFGPWLILKGYTKAIEGFRTQFQQSYFSLVVHCIWLASKDYLPTKLQIDRALPWLALNCCQFGCLVPNVPNFEFELSNADWWMTELAKVRATWCKTPGSHNYSSYSKGWTYFCSWKAGQKIWIEWNSLTVELDTWISELPLWKEEYQAKLLLFMVVWLVNILLMVRRWKDRRGCCF